LQLLSPYQTLNGKNYHIEDNAYWRALRFIENSYTLEKCENTTQAFAAGQGFGHFLARLSDFNSPDFQTIIPHFHDAEHRWKQFNDALKNATPNRFDMAEEDILFALNHAHLVDFYKKIIKKMPVRVTHNDTKIANLLFDKNTHKPLAVIDLDTLQYGTMLSEFGDMVRSYCNNTREDEENFRKISFRFDIFDALKEGFLSELKEVLTPIEIQNLDFGAKLTIFIQGIRFLTDFLNNDIYYKIKYSDHNLVRAKNQFALLQSFN
jgi:aminoglycoside phosphotransferase (APT) family kinase protein